MLQDFDNPGGGRPGFGIYSDTTPKEKRASTRLSTTKQYQGGMLLIKADTRLQHNLDSKEAKTIEATFPLALPCLGRDG